MAEVKGLAIHQYRQKQQGDKPEQTAPAAAIVEGRKVESIVSDEQWNKWLGVEARIYNLTQARSTTLDLAPSIIENSVLNNYWRGISVVIANGEQKNDIQPEITDFQSAVRRLKEMTNLRISPMIIHPDGRHEEGFYRFENENFSGIIFIDSESSVSPEAVSNLSASEMAHLSEMKVRIKQGQVGGANDGNGALSSGEETALQAVKDRYQAGEIAGDDSPTTLTISDLNPENQEIKEVKELVSFEEIEAFQRRGRSTLTAIVYAKQPKLESPVQNQSNEFVKSTVPIGAAQDRPVEGQVSAADLKETQPLSNFGGNPFVGGTITDPSRITILPGAIKNPDNT